MIIGNEPGFSYFSGSAESRGRGGAVGAYSGKGCSGFAIRSSSIAHASYSKASASKTTAPEAQATSEDTTRGACGLAPGPGQPELGQLDDSLNSPALQVHTVRGVTAEDGGRGGRELRI